MKTYFIKQQDNKKYLTTIYRNSLSDSNDTGNKLEFTSQEQAMAFLDMVKTIQAPSTFDSCKWAIYVQEVSVTIVN